MRRSLRLAAVVLALLTPACPPPSDVRTVDPVRTAGSATGGTPGGGPAPGEAAGESAAVEFPAPTDAPRPVVFESLRGGVHVARCPACGEVQHTGADRCPGCGQGLSPWRRETTCVSCGGEGRCDRCGDDRPCLVCDGDGLCAPCGGKGTGAAGTCFECEGDGTCDACRRDGVRESVHGDFGPDESFLPGTCPTCVDGSGLCPECGTGAKDAAGGTCATCEGRGTCPDCGGLGSCPHCAGDGSCEDCAGGGRLVLNGAPRRASERLRSVRTATGSVLAPAIVAQRPTTSVLLVRSEGGNAVSTSLERAQVHPLSWWLAVRDFPPGEDGRDAVGPGPRAAHEMSIASLAAEARYWPLAEASLRRARALDPGRAADVDATLRDVETRRFRDWHERAESAQKSGDLGRGARFLEMIAFQGRGTTEGKRAEVAILLVRKRREDAAAATDEASRALAAERSRDAVTRAVARARARLERARSLLERAERAAADDPLRERTWQRADAAAAVAERVVAEATFRDPPSRTPWPETPESLLRRARTFRGTVAASRAGGALTGGRFALAVRLARRALVLDPAEPTAARCLDDACHGLARRGVLGGSPPPEKR